jgi:DNA-binding LytR/AlgR family response regulator
MKTYQSSGKDIFLIINHKTAKKVLVNQVILLKGNINYTTLHLDNGKKKVVPHTLKFYETFLATHGFLRVHRSFMINPDFVKEYDAELEIIRMTNGQEAQISRRRKHCLTDSFRPLVDVPTNQEAGSKEFPD